LNIVSHERGKNDLGGIEGKIFSWMQILDYKFFYLRINESKLSSSDHVFENTCFFCKVNGFMCQHGNNTLLGIYEPWNRSLMNL
jgi:hypothetical protein